MRFQAFQNETDSLVIDDLTVENRLDRISLYGSMQITRDQAGLSHARALKALVDAALTLLESETLPDHVTLAPPDETDNPFA